MLTIYSTDIIVSFGWTTAAVTTCELWSSSDGVSWILAATEAVSSDEGGFMWDYTTLMLGGEWVKAKVFGDGVQYPLDSFEWSNQEQCPP